MPERQRVTHQKRRFFSASCLVSMAGLLTLATLVTAGCVKHSAAAGPPATAAGADPSEADLETARGLFAGAIKDEEAQDWAAAREKLQRAGAIKMTPGIRFHIALCEENLKYPCEALNDYIAAVNQARDNEDSEVLLASIDGLGRLASRLQVLKTFSPTAAGHIGVQCQPRGGDDTMDKLRAEAEARQEEGVKRHTVGDVAGAWLAFKQAYTIYPSPKILWNLALSELDTGRNLDAARHLHTYAALKDPSVTQEKKKIASKRLAEARKKLGGILVEAAQGAKISVDEEPLPQGYEDGDLIELDPGHHVVVAELGPLRQERSIKVKLGKVTKVAMDESAKTKPPDQVKAALK
ncbi:hypothetical protein LVJ94_43725 [Pendulispora rubella]|uniref:Uncharacterized protein n=1 Tax=Pendulispora rubella TaxID=2741070 RepID=A0ABZ2KYQ0_9BACT